jgi:hypothetical protein
MTERNCDEQYATKRQHASANCRLKRKPILHDWKLETNVFTVQMLRHFASPSHIERKKLVQQPFMAGTFLEVPSPHAANLEIWETIYLRWTARTQLLALCVARRAHRKRSHQVCLSFCRTNGYGIAPQASGQTPFRSRRLFPHGATLNQQRQEFHGHGAGQNFHGQVEIRVDSRMSLIAAFLEKSTT